MSCADLTVLAELDGKPVGLAVTIPDVNEAIRPLNGRLFHFGLPIGLLRLPWLMRRIKTARMAILLVAEGYRNRGIAELLILHTLDFARSNLPYTGAELGWTDRRTAKSGSRDESEAGEDGIGPPLDAFGGRSKRFAGWVDQAEDGQSGVGQRSERLGQAGPLGVVTIFVHQRSLTKWRQFSTSQWPRM